MSCVSQDLFSRFKENVLFCEMFGNTRSHDMLKRFTEDTGQGYWPVISWLGLSHFFLKKNKG